VNFNIKFGTN